MKRLFIILYGASSVSEVASRYKAIESVRFHILDKLFDLFHILARICYKGVSRSRRFIDSGIDLFRFLGYSCGKLLEFGYILSLIGPFDKILQRQNVFRAQGSQHMSDDTVYIDLLLLCIYIAYSLTDLFR